MKKSLLTFIMVLYILGVYAQNPISILEARAQVTGTVTVQGIVTNDANKMGYTYYVQDATAAIAVYDAKLGTAGVKQGDIIKVTGTLKDYSNLLEISPVTSVTIVSSGNTLPAPVVVEASKLGEDYESMLITVKNCMFAAADQGKTFSTGTASGFNYKVTSTGVIFDFRLLKNVTDIVGTVIPSGSVDITGNLGQYSTLYQLQPRAITDIVSNSSIKMSSAVDIKSITKTGITLNWKTDNAGTTEIKYGKTPALELGVLKDATLATDHAMTIPGAASELFYAKVYSVSGTVTTDTAKVATAAYITESNSTGEMQAYFNNPVDISVSSGKNAEYLDKQFDEKLIDYIAKAKSTIDIAIYNFNNTNLSNISTALNSAADRGVNIRVIYCGTTLSAGADELSNKIKKLIGPGSKNNNYPTRDGIMHNKFMVIDANSTNANEPYVWTGSTNWTDGNMNTDPNNVIIIQDQSLAKVYTVEFEEMWGSNTMDPNMSKAKFGNQKTENTPTELVIGGKRVECYFSPSGKVNSRIISLAKSAEKDLSIAVMLITPREIAYAVSDANHQGALTKCIVNSKEECTITNTDNTKDLRTVNALAGACKEYFIDFSNGGTMHNKYMIVDQSFTTSDPLVLTGSHNWSSSADTRNDENVLVIHDATLANVYYQNFVELLKGGTVILDVPQIVENSGTNIYPNPCKGNVNINYLASKPTDAKVKILDLTGRTVLEKSFSLQEGQNTLSLELKKMSGVYLVKVEANQKAFNQKIIVNN